VDRNTSGMGLGLAICQAAHPGASRKDMGGERVADGKQVYILIAMDQG